MNVIHRITFHGTKIHFWGEFSKYICTVIQRVSVIREISWFDLVKPRFLFKTVDL